jgi:hypothetical protein
MKPEGIQAHSRDYFRKQLLLVLWNKVIKALLQIRTTVNPNFHPFPALYIFPFPVSKSKQNFFALALVWESS